MIAAHIRKICFFTVTVIAVLFILSLADRETTGGEKDSLRVTLHKKGHAFPGVTLFPEEGTARVKLLDMDGTLLHEWNIDADRARLLPGSCNLLVVHGTKWGAKVEPWRKLRKFAREYAWNGSVVWEYEAEDVIHHDIRRLDNGNTMFLRRTIVPEEFQYRIEDPARRMTRIRSDSIIEVAPDGGKVWEWHAHEHLDLNRPGAGGFAQYTSAVGPKFRMQDWTHINTAAPIGENHWYSTLHDERFKPGNIIAQARNWSETFIISRATGDVVWRYTGDYRGGVSGGHEAHLIPAGLPGAGDLLLFDNGRKTHDRESIVLQLDPVTKDPGWTYEAGQAFYSEAAGSAQRLPNGNTLISEDRRGRVFEVTPDKNIVWQLLGPHQSNRAHRYEYSHCGDSGKVQEAVEAKERGGESLINTLKASIFRAVS